jgi:hypothetical protein
MSTRIAVATLTAAGAWAVAAWWAVPMAVAAARPAASGLLGQLLKEFAQQWPPLAEAGLTLCLLAGLLAIVMARPGWFTRVVGPAAPEALAGIRILACAVLLLDVTTENLTGTAILPPSMRNPVGLTKALSLLPGFETFQADARALGLFQGATVALLTAGLIGWKTRLTLPAAAIATIVLGGLARQYAWFYHQGLIPCYVLLVLCATPCADAWSMDRRQAERRGDPVPPARAPQPIYGWARYACWVAIALPYFAAGASKLRFGGWTWWRATNMRSILFEDSLSPMEFNSPLSLWLSPAPDVVFMALGLAAVAGELGYVSVLLWPRARRVVPWVMAGMHAGIAALQNVLFLDLILLQLAFADLPAWVDRLRGRSAPSLSVAPSRPAVPPPRPLTAPILGVSVLAALLLVCWIHRIEMYPLTAMQMYTRPRGPIVAYQKVFVRHADGTESDQTFPRMAAVLRRNGRYRRILRSCLEPAQAEQCEAFLSAVGHAYNATRPAQARVHAVIVERWAWNFRMAPADPQRGQRIARAVIAISESGRAAVEEPLETTTAAAPHLVE